MPIEKDATPAVNFSFRPAGRPRGWVDSPITAVGEDGTVYHLTGVVDAEGNIISPVSQNDLAREASETNRLLRLVVLHLEHLTGLHGLTED